MTYETTNKTARHNSSYDEAGYRGEDHAGWRPVRHPGAARPTTREIDAKAILSNDREVVILHNDQRYVLRLTRLNKLILTK